MGGDVSLHFGRWHPCSQAMPTQHIVEGFFELLAEAWVDNGVNTAVEVTQPKGYFKDGFRGL